jgi:small subunit ribosomal protein S14
MPKKSQKNRDARRAALIDRYAEKRAELRKKLKSGNVEIDEKLEALAALEKLPTNSCPARRTRRCRVTGRSKAVYRKFGVSRIMLREMALRGELPGVRKSSW